MVVYVSFLAFPSSPACRADSLVLPLEMKLMGLRGGVMCSPVYRAAGSELVTECPFQ